MTEHDIDDTSSSARSGPRLARRGGLALLFMTLLVPLGCSSGAAPTDDPPPAPAHSAPSESRSAAEAAALALTFIHAQPGGATKTISREHVENDPQTKNPLLFIFTFADGGFAIVSAQKQQVAILGYSVADPFDLDKFEAGVAPPGLIGLLDEHARVAHELDIKTLDPRAFDPESGKLTPQALPPGEDPCPGDDCPPRPPSNCQNSTTERTVRASANWDQNCGDMGPGWNAYAPLATGGPCGRALTGCVATATGIVMKWHGRGNGYNFASMSDSVSTWEAARLLREVGNRVGMDYGATGSTSHVEEVDNALQSFGYNATLVGFSLSAVRTEINAGRPLVMRGASECSFLFVSWSCDGHVWVVDGYKDVYLCGMGYYTYLRINWGWGGGSNGYYNFNALSPYNYDKKLVIGIRPR
jgi:hypothetical protein